MKVYRFSKCGFIRQLDGFGAFNYGGRWNNKGHAVVYTAGSRSLALLEALAHIEHPPIPDFCIAKIFVPDDAIQTYPFEDLPLSWKSYPEPDILKAIGDSFLDIKASMVLKVPSVIVSEEFNFLINPLHPRIGEVKIIEVVNQEIDDRLV